MTAHSGEEARALRVLHVKDNAGDVRLVAEALRELGIALEVYVAPDRSQAMEFLRHEARFTGAQRPDLILLDLNLPRKGRTGDPRRDQVRPGAQSHPSGRSKHIHCAVRHRRGIRIACKLLCHQAR